MLQLGLQSLWVRISQYNSKKKKVDYSQIFISHYNVGQKKDAQCISTGVNKLLREIIFSC